MQVYNCKDRKVARVIASENISKLNISMTELMDKMGLDTERDIEDLNRLRQAKDIKYFAHEGEVTDEREVDDHQTQIKALEISLKLKGHLRDKEPVSSSTDFEREVEIVPHPNGDKLEVENRVKAFMR